ncbi:MAG: strawberry notch C-terminal domain-containing protein [Bacteroidia bacterium]|nr:strawberry notch C-terminal domain-containing protein [Bacteroidia bacterium]
MKNNNSIKLAKEFNMIGSPYIPASISCENNSLKVDVPDSMAYEMQQALETVKRAVGGSINDFVIDRLGYRSNADLCKALAAEQIDGVALAIYNIEAKGQALIIGDQTGIGKGRQAAAVIRYGVHRGLKPIFITEKPNLFSDLYRDLIAIGSGHLVPFIVNGKESKTDIKDEDGIILHQAMEAGKQKSVFESLKVPADCHFVMLTYSQIATNETDKRTGELISLSVKSNYITQIAKDNIMIIDEAHNASGSSNTGQVLQGIVAQTIGVTFLSATFAKRPDNMPIYAMKTAMSDANMTSEELVEAIVSGGVALQEILSSQLVAEGQMLRRERTMEGIVVKYITLDALEKTHCEIADRITEIIRDVIEFQGTDLKPVFDNMDDIAAAEYKEVEGRKGTSKAGIDNQPYFSKVFNVINQMLMSIKADAVADEAIIDLKAGRKPVIAFANTMGSFLEDLGVEEGETINADFAVVLQKGLDGVLRYTVKDAEGKSTYKTIPISDLSPDAKIKYMAIQEKIEKVSTGISISPIDYIIQKIRKAGFSVVEVTGRKYELQLNLVSDFDAKPVKSKSKNGIQISDLSPRLKKLMPKIQQSAIIGNAELHEIIERLNKQVDEIPKLYSTDKAYGLYKNKLPKHEQPIKFSEFAVAKAHFFIGGSDWYVLEWDGQDTIYGYAILNGDTQNAEYGYTSLKEIQSVRINKMFGVELDFYFIPKPMNIIIKTKGGYDEQSGQTVGQNGQTVQNLSGCNCPVRKNKFNRFLGLIDESKAMIKRFQGVITKRKRINTNDAFAQFNNNEVDCLMINQSGSTGASAHAIATNKVSRDQVKQRVFTGLQMELDVNTQVQKMGRVNRTGQILKPEYKYISSAIPAEKRLFMMMQKKLKSLNANTTSNQKQSDKILTSEDFLNKIGDRVVREYLIENNDKSNKQSLNMLIDDPLKLNESEADSKNENNFIENAAQKVSGRVAVLSTKMQAEFYNEIVLRYNKRVEYLKQTGEYDLEVEAMDLQAEVIETTILKSGKGGKSAFGHDTILQKVYANVLKKPFSKKEIQQKLNDVLKGTEPEVMQREMLDGYETYIANKLKEDLRENDSRYSDLIAKVPEEKAIKKIVNQNERKMMIAARIDDLEKAKSKESQNIETKAENNKQYLMSFFNFYYVGRGINYPSITFGEGNQTFTKAIFLGIEIDLNRKNPYAPSSVGFKFALGDSNKYIELPASGETGLKLQSIIGASTNLTSNESRSILENWDEIVKTKNVNRNIRYIVTGNLLQAFSTTKGKLISYTTLKKGEILKGIYLPENYNPEIGENANKVTVPIGAAKKYIKSVQPGAIVSTTNNVSLTMNIKGDLVVMVKGTKKQGGWLFLNKEILEVVNNNNFDLISDTMRAYVEHQNIDKFIDILQNKFNTSVTVNQNIFDVIKKDVEAFKKSQGQEEVILKVNKSKPFVPDAIEMELEAEALMLELELMEL